MASKALRRLGLDSSGLPSKVVVDRVEHGNALPYKDYVEFWAGMLDVQKATKFVKELVEEVMKVEKQAAKFAKSRRDVTYMVHCLAHTLRFMDMYYAIDKSNSLLRKVLKAYDQHRQKHRSPAADAIKNLSRRVMNDENRVQLLQPAVIDAAFVDGPRSGAAGSDAGGHGGSDAGGHGGAGHGGDAGGSLGGFSTVGDFSFVDPYLRQCLLRPKATLLLEERALRARLSAGRMHHHRGSAGDGADEAGVAAGVGTPMYLGATRPTHHLTAPKQVFDSVLTLLRTMPMQLHHQPSLAGGSLLATVCSLLHLLREYVATHPVADSCYLLVQALPVVRVYLGWPRPYCDVARGAVDALEAEARAPGAVLRARLRGEMPLLGPGPAQEATAQIAATHQAQTASAGGRGSPTTAPPPIPAVARRRSASSLSGRTADADAVEITRWAQGQRTAMVYWCSDGRRARLLQLLCSDHAAGSGGASAAGTVPLPDAASPASGASPGAGGVPSPVHQAEAEREMRAVQLALLGHMLEADLCIEPSPPSAPAGGGGNGARAPSVARALRLRRRARQDPAKVKHWCARAWQACDDAEGVDDPQAAARQRQQALLALAEEIDPTMGLAAIPRAFRAASKSAAAVAAAAGRSPPRRGPSGGAAPAPAHPALWRCVHGQGAVPRAPPLRLRFELLKPWGAPSAQDTPVYPIPGNFNDYFESDGGVTDVRARRDASYIRYEGEYQSLLDTVHAAVTPAAVHQAAELAAAERDGMKEQAAAATAAEQKSCVRLCVMGGDAALHRVVAAFAALHRLQPELCAAVEFRVFLVPVGHCDLAAYVAQRDGWYRRQVYAPFASALAFCPALAAYPPPNLGDLLPAGGGGGKAGAHHHHHHHRRGKHEGFVGGSVASHEDEECDMDDEDDDDGSVRMPAGMLKPLLTDYVRGARQRLPVQLYDCHCWSTGSGPDAAPHVTIPFCQRVEVGVNVDVRAAQLAARDAARQARAASGRGAALPAQGSPAPQGAAGVSGGGAVAWGGGDEAMPSWDAVLMSGYVTAGRRCRIGPTPELIVSHVGMDIDGRFSGAPQEGTAASPNSTLDLRAADRQVVSSRRYCAVVAGNVGSFTSRDFDGEDAEGRGHRHRTRGGAGIGGGAGGPGAGGSWAGSVTADPVPGGVPASPVTPWLELHTVECRGAVADLLEKKRGDRRQKDVNVLRDCMRSPQYCRTRHAGQIDVRCEVPERSFVCMVDGQLFGPFHRIQITPCRAFGGGSGQGPDGLGVTRLTLPLMTFFPVADDE